MAAPPCGAGARPRCGPLFPLYIASYELRHRALGQIDLSVGSRTPVLGTRLDMPAYRLEYVLPGRVLRSVDYISPEPLKPGQRLVIDGTYLLVERVVRHKHGDQGPERVMCKLVVG